VTEQSDAVPVKDEARIRQSSPVSAGGGGVTLEHRVGAWYLARLLTGGPVPELGPGRRVRRVSFQQEQRSPVDDLIVLGDGPDDSDPPFELFIAVRRNPRIIPSSADTQALVSDFIEALHGIDDAQADHIGFGIVVGGRRDHAGQLAELADLATDQADEEAFFGLVQRPAYRAALVDRLGQVEKLVSKALTKPDHPAPTDAEVRRRTWDLLHRLVVLMPELEEPHVGDRTTMIDGLIGVARGRDLAGATALADRLDVLAARFGPRAATVELSGLRRNVHDLIEPEDRRHVEAWQLLKMLDEQARAGVGQVVEVVGGGEPFRIDRTARNADILNLVESSPGAQVVGESGVGKSAVAVSLGGDGQREEMQVTSVNLRQLPERAMDLAAALCCDMATALSELSAPQRVLVIDGADAVLETGEEMFRHVIDSARQAEVAVVAVSSHEAAGAVKHLMETVLSTDIPTYEISELTDPELDMVVDRFPELARVATNPRSRELLRRLVVVDLLVRSGLGGVPLTEADVMAEVWNGLVRRRERQDRGSPTAREHVMLQLAERELSGASPLSLVGHIDAETVDALRQDGLLRASDSQWQPLPTFGHDELRRYAAARVLLATDDLAATFTTFGAPRWALSAVRLACQEILARPDSTTDSLHGRFVRVQTAFELIAVSHGQRWADVPSEALLTLADPMPVLRDAWVDLRGGDAAGLRRLLRVVGQRHRVGGVVDLAIIEPIIELLVDEDTPWAAEKEIAGALRDWLIAAVTHDVPSGHPLRTKLRNSLIATCDTAEQSLRDRMAGVQAAAEQRQSGPASRLGRESSLLRELGVGGRRRRPRPDVPPELLGETLLELLALLGPDLGDDGEKVLRRVAADAPGRLAPAVDEVIVGRSLAAYGRGLLADLVEAYYIDDEEDGFGYGIGDDGIRSHQSRLPIWPMAAYYRGPFRELFSTDFVRGVAVVNRMLNHAARVRVQRLRGLARPAARVPSRHDESNGYLVELAVNGDERREYVGDPHVWCWYCGTAVGPYPCVSALQALELVCDELIAISVPIERIVEVLLDGCENLAMVGLVVGLLVRHLGVDHDELLDPFLVEPAVWSLEFARVMGERSRNTPTPEGLIGKDRRAWSFRDVAVRMALSAGPERILRLRELEADLVRRGTQVDWEDRTGDATFSGDEAVIRGWAAVLDRERYRLTPTEGRIQIEFVPPDDVRDALEPDNADLRRGQECLRLVSRYFFEGRHNGERGSFTAEELTADAEVARDLVENPPTHSAFDVWSGVAAVASALLREFLVNGVTVDDETARFAVEAVVYVAETVEPSTLDSEETMFEEGPDRLAADALPLLLLPRAGRVLDVLADDQGSSRARVVSAMQRLARAVPGETRLHLARSMDALWSEPCGPDECHHRTAIAVVHRFMDDCIIGPWDVDTQRHPRLAPAEPLAASIAAIDADDLDFRRLDAPIRALGQAAGSKSCVHDEATDLLSVLKSAQLRVLLTHDDYDHRGSSMMITARALLLLAATQGEAVVDEYIDAIIDNGDLLGSFLRALAAASEESRSAAEIAARIWPGVIMHVLDLVHAGHQPFSGGYFGDAALAALVPAATPDAMFLYREVDGAPVQWFDVLACSAAVEAWLPVATGRPQCVDALVAALSTTHEGDQVSTGLRWVAALVEPDVDGVARRSFFLSRWLIDLRAAAINSDENDVWQRLVDSLVVAGVAELVPYSE
jgi:hypothetical protein